MRITVAICTWNRAKLLTQTLVQMARIIPPAGLEWELLVVNNNCTDETDTVIADFSHRLPLRRVSQPVPGLSNARNAAVAAAGGDYILWTDDDVLVDQQWLTAYARAFERWPEAAVFGGPIEPWFEGTPPGWLTRAWPHVADAYASRDLGQQPIPLTSEGGLLPYGANYAIRMIEQSQHPYDPDLGRRPDGTVLGEETAVIAAILQTGGSGRWVPDARVRHWVPKSRQTLGYIRDYYQGVGLTRNKQMPERAGTALLFGKPLWLWRATLRAQAVYLLRRPFVGPEIWVKDMTTAVSYWAQLRSPASRT